MKRQFIIPITCALTFHAVLLFGSRGEPNKVKGVTDDLPLIRLKAFPDPIYEPPVNDLEGQSSDAEALKGEPDPPRPQGEDLPQKPKPDDFLMNPVETPPLSPIIVKNIVSGFMGIPEGTDNASGIRGIIFDRSQLDYRPRVLVQAPPLYPSEARMRGIEGDVIVGFIVGQTGRVVSIHVIRSSAPIFERAALKAVKKWRFEPGRRMGRAVRFVMRVPIQFSLRNL